MEDDVLVLKLVVDEQREQARHRGKDGDTPCQKHDGRWLGQPGEFPLQEPEDEARNKESDASIDEPFAGSSSKERPLRRVRELLYEFLIQ